MHVLPYLSAAVAAGIAILGGRQLKKRARRHERVEQRRQKLEELAQAGMVFSRRYDLGGATLIIDEPALEWALIDHNMPLLARTRPISAISGCYGVQESKLHGGVRRINEAAMLRSGTGASNREFYQTDIASGLEIRLNPPEEDVRLYIDCLDSELSPDWVKTILDHFKEKAEKGNEK